MSFSLSGAPLIKHDGTMFDWLTRIKDICREIQCSGVVDGALLMSKQDKEKVPKSHNYCDVHFINYGNKFIAGRLVAKFLKWNFESAIIKFVLFLLMQSI